MDDTFKSRAKAILRNAGEVVQLQQGRGVGFYNAVIVLGAMVNQGFEFSESTTANDISKFILELNSKNTLKS
jgi:hypothetical protein